MSDRRQAAQESRAARRAAAPTPPRMWSGRLRGPQPLVPRTVVPLLLATALGVAALLYGAVEFRNLADVAGRPARQVTITSCHTARTSNGHHSPTGCDADGSGDTVKLNDHGYLIGEVVTVRCTGADDCEESLGSWAGDAQAAVGLGLLLTVNGLARLGRSATARYAPAREEFFRRRSTVLAVLGLTGLAGLLLLTALPVGLLVT